MSPNIFLVNELGHFRRDYVSFFYRVEALQCHEWAKRPCVSEHMIYIYIHTYTYYTALLLGSDYVSFDYSIKTISDIYRLRRKYISRRWYIDNTECTNPKAIFLLRGVRLYRHHIFSQMRNFVLGNIDIKILFLVLFKISVYLIWYIYSKFVTF